MSSPFNFHGEISRFSVGDETNMKVRQNLVKSLLRVWVSIRVGGQNHELAVTALNTMLVDQLTIEGIFG